MIGVFITAIGIFGADNSIGTWKRDIAKSKTSPAVANPIKGLTIVYEAVDGGVKMTVTGGRQDGTAINGGDTIKYDGKDYPITGAPWDTIALRQIDANTFTSEARRTDGKYHATSRTVISANGKTMKVGTQVLQLQTRAPQAKPNEMMVRVGDAVMVLEGRLVKGGGGDGGAEGRFARSAMEACDGARDTCRRWFRQHRCPA